MYIRGTHTHAYNMIAVFCKTSRRWLSIHAPSFLFYFLHLFSATGTGITRGVGGEGERRPPPIQPPPPPLLPGAPNPFLRAKHRSIKHTYKQYTNKYFGTSCTFEVLLYSFFGTRCVRKITHRPSQNGHLVFARGAATASKGFIADFFLFYVSDGCWLAMV